MGVSPTKTGEMREDQFWLLKSRAVWAYYDEIAGCPIEPVTTEKVTYVRDMTAIYKQAEELHDMARFHGTTLHGRRVNDEVELFEWDNEKETPGLRESLEAKGLTVRTYVPESAKKNKFPKPTYKPAVGEDAGFTPLEKCVSSLKTSIRGLEKAEGVMVDYAILADTGKKSKKIMLVCNFRPKEFYDWYSDELETITIEGVPYEVLGAVDCGEVQLKCSDETFMSFFKVNSSGYYHADVISYNHARAQNIADREAVKAEKKQAKKHRRQATTSTVTSPSETLFVAQLADDEAVKAKRREKNKMKKKAQKERRKVRLAEMEEEESKTTNKDEEQDREKMNEATLELVGHSGSFCVVRNNGGKHILLPEKGLRIIDLKARKRSESANREPSLSDDTSSSTSDDINETEGVTRVKVLHVRSPQDINRVIAEANGAPIMVATTEKDESQEAQSQEAQSQEAQSQEAQSQD